MCLQTRLAFTILAMLFAAFVVTSANNQCKNIVMDLIMKQCRLGTRNRRDIEKFDLEKSDYEKPGATDVGPSSVTSSESLRVYEKRQLSPERVASIAVPIVSEAIQGALKANDYAAPRKGYYVPPPPAVLPPPAIPYPQPRYPLSPLQLLVPYSQTLRPQTLEEENLDFDLNHEEIDELYNEVYDRSARAPKEEARKYFMMIAAKCCQNVQLCLKDARQISCFGL